MSSSALAPVQNAVLPVGTSSAVASKATSSKFASALSGVSVTASRGSARLTSQAVSVVDIRRVRVVDVRAAADGSGEVFGTTMGVSANGSGATMVAERPFTGGVIDFTRATAPLTPRPMENAKTVVLVRHGLSSWNEEGRVQGSSDMSILSEVGRMQALRVRDSLAMLKFGKCFASPIARAKTSAELIWEGREEPLVYLDTLREANLHFLEGMLNSEAQKQYPELFRSWREDPLNFNVNGVYPVVELWAKARSAWEEILSSPGERLLVVTHKSILRAMLCTALGLGPDRSTGTCYEYNRDGEGIYFLKFFSHNTLPDPYSQLRSNGLTFRGVDVHNAGISTFTVNTRGEPMLASLNRTAHLHVDGVYYLD